MGSFTGKTSIQNGALSVATLNKVVGGTASSSLGAPTTAANGTIDLGSLTATGTLVITGTAQNTDRVINLAGTTGGGVIDQSGTGALVFSSALTATGAGSKTLTLQGSTAGTGQLSGSVVDNSVTNKTSLLKRGTGKWTLFSPNTHSGGTTLAEGTLVLGNANALGSGTFTINEGATLDASGAMSLPALGKVWNGSFTFRGSSALDLTAGSVALTANSTVTVSAGSLTVANISGGYALGKDGAGTLVLAGTNTYTGVTTLLAGTLIVNGSSAFPAGASLSAATGSTILLQNGAALPSYSGGGTVIYGPGSPVVVGGGDLSGEAALALSGSSSLTKTGNGAITFTSPGTFTGKTWIQSGALSVSTLNKVVGGTASSSLGAPTTTANGTIDLGSLAATGTLVITGTAQTTDRIINLAGTTGGGVLDQSGTGTAVFGGSVTSSGGGSKTLTLQGSSSGSAQITGIISNLSSTFTTALLKQGTGTWNLSGSNTYSGGTTLADGTLRLGNASALGSGTLTLAGGALDNSAGSALTLLGNIGIYLTGDFSFLGTNSLNVGSGNLVMSGDRTITVNGSTLQFDGNVSGGGALTKAGSGTLVLSGSNDLSAVNLSGGTLQLNSGSAAGSGTISTSSGSSLSLGAIDGLPNGLTHRWSFNEIAGTSLADSVGTANGAIITPNGYSSSATLSSGTVTLNGASRAAASYVKFPAGMLSGLTSMTLEVWSSINANVSWPYLFTFSDVEDFTSGTEKTFFANPLAGSTAQGMVSVRALGGGAFDGAYNATTVLGQVYHYAIVWDAAVSQVRLYRDGTLMTTVSVAGRSLSEVSSNVFYLGRSPYTWDTAFNESYREVRLYNRALSASEIAASSVAGAENLVPVLSNPSFANEITGSGSLLKLRSNTATLLGANSYAGGTTISAGSLVVYSEGALGSGPVTVNSGATLRMDAASDFTLANALAGSGSFLKSGSGTIILTGSSTSTGPMTVAAGTLKLVQGATLGSGSVSVSSGATLAFDLTSDLTVPAAITGNVVSVNPAFKVSWNGGAVGGPTSVVTSDLSKTVEQGAPLSFQIVATNGPTAFSATGLPAGLSLNATTGLLSGTPAVAGTSNVTLSVTNPGGTITATLALSVREVQRVIGIHFADNATLDALDTLTSKGPLKTKVWNVTAGNTASKTGLLDDKGYATSINVSWTSPNTWRNTSSTATQDGRLVYGYLDDGVNGNSVTVTNIPYASYNVYGIVASDNSLTPYNTQDFRVNSTYVFGGSVASSAPAFGSWEASGYQWVLIDSVNQRRGNYWKMTGLTGGTVTITGSGAVFPNRGSLAGIIIEGNPVPTITRQPESRFASAGTPVTLTVEATAPSALTYQWYQDGALIEGGTQTTLTVPNASGSGNYYVAVGGQFGTTLSNVVHVEALPLTGSSLWMTGYNAFGQLGDGTTTQRNSPVKIADGVVGVSPNGAHTLYVTADRKLYGMGSNSSGALGDGTTTQRNTPVLISSAVVTASAGAANISGALGHSHFIKTDGSLWGMGYNAVGQLGDASTTQRTLPVWIAANVVSVVDSRTSSSAASFSYFVKADGSLWAMGNNASGQLGDGTTVNRYTPVRIAENVAQVSAGALHAGFVKTDGTLWMMGVNGSG